MRKQWGCKAGRAIDRHLRKTGSAIQLPLCYSQLLITTFHFVPFTRLKTSCKHQFRQRFLRKFNDIWEFSQHFFSIFFFFLHSQNARTTCLQVDVRFDSVYETVYDAREGKFSPTDSLCINWIFFVFFSLSSCCCDDETVANENGELTSRVVQVWKLNHRFFYLAAKFFLNIHQKF